jgi:hypothetical protein
MVNGVPTIIPFIPPPSQHYYITKMSAAILGTKERCYPLKRKGKTQDDEWSKGEERLTHAEKLRIRHRPGRSKYTGFQERAWKTPT